MTGRAKGSDVGTPIRVLLVEDHKLVRAGLCMLIDAAPTLRVVGEAATHAEALVLAANEQPDIVLLDLLLGAESGVDLLPELATAAPDARVIVLSGVQDLEMRRNAIKAGAVGFVDKEAAADVLLNAIHKVHGGEAWIDRVLTADALRHAARTDQAAAGEMARIATLTPREREVIALVGEGLKNGQISTRLAISEATVRHHLTSVFDKLDVGDRFELALYAYQYRLAKVPASGPPRSRASEAADSKNSQKGRR